MTGRDHAAEAGDFLKVASREVSANFEVQTGEKKSDVLAAALVHATLALVEQQRIANLIAVARTEFWAGNSNFEATLWNEHIGPALGFDTSWVRS